MAEDLDLIPDSFAPNNEQIQAPNILAKEQVDAAAKLSNVLMPGPVMPDEKIAQNLRAPEDRRNDIPTNNNNMYNEGKVSLVGAVDPNIKPGVAEGMGGDVIKAKIPETDNTGVDKEADHKAADEQDEQRVPINDRIDQDRIDPDANTDVVNKENKVDNDDDGGDDDDGSDVNDDVKSSDLEKGHDSDFKGSGTTEDDKEDEDDTGDSNDDGDTGENDDEDVKEDNNDSDSDSTDENTDDDTTEDNDNDGDDDDDMKDNNVYDDDRMDNNDDDDDTEDSDDSKGDVEGSSTENPLRLIQEDLNRKVQDGKYNFSALELDHLTRNLVCACVCANIKAVCSHLCYKYLTQIFL